MGETIVYALKVAAAVAGGVIAIALFNALFSVITLPQIPVELEETLHLISIYLPFNPTRVLNYITTVLVALIGFLTGYIIYIILSEVRKES